MFETSGRKLKKSAFFGGKMKNGLHDGVQSIGVGSGVVREMLSISIDFRDFYTLSFIDFYMR